MSVVVDKESRGTVEMTVVEGVDGRTFQFTETSAGVTGFFDEAELAAFCEDRGLDALDAEAFDAIGGELREAAADAPRLAHGPFGYRPLSKAEQAVLDGMRERYGI